MDKINSIRVLFENFEYADIKRKDIESFNISGITKSYHIAPFIKDNYENNTCEEFSLRLFPAANVQMTNGDTALTVFERIQKYDDIECVKIEFETATPMEINVKWNGSLETNKNQSSVILNNGVLLIVCSPDTTAKQIKERTEKPVKIYYGE